MIVNSDDDWTWEVLHIDKKNHYVLQRARGAEGDVGIIGIPNVELCTFTFLNKGLLDIMDYDTPNSEEGLGVMGEGVKFHYKYLRHGYGTYNPSVGRVDWFGKPLPTFEEIYKIASKQHVKLKTVSDTSEFYCISDPYDKIVWAGNLYYIDHPDNDLLKKLNMTRKSQHVFEIANDGSKIVAFSDGININGNVIEPYVPHELAKYDKAITVSGPSGSVFAKIAHHGAYNKSNEDVDPRYVQQS